MKHRAIKDLNQLTDENLFLEISIGHEKIYENCIELWKSAITLTENKKFRGFRIIEAFAIEEAAKYLILLDSMRCPRSEKELFTGQLRKFNEHLAKGLYSKACNWRPDTYGRLCEYIRADLDQFYIDGPEGIEWIFRNSIISKREECLYVDYVDYGDEHGWLTPQSQAVMDDLISITHEPSVIQMIKAIDAAGISKPESLKLFSKFWRDFMFSDETHYQEFRNANIRSLEILDKSNLLGNVTDGQYSLITIEYPFPLYKEEMKEIKVSKELLKEKQQNWSPEW